MASLSFQTGAAYKNKNRPEDIGRFLHWQRGGLFGFHHAADENQHTADEEG